MHYDAILQGLKRTRTRQQEALNATDNHITILESLRDQREKEARPNEPRLPLDEPKKPKA